MWLISDLDLESSHATHAPAQSGPNPYAYLPKVPSFQLTSTSAALTGLLAALRDSSPAPLEFEFAIMVGGFTSTTPRHAELFRHKLTVPSVHVMGRGDGIVPRQDSLLLADRFADPLVIEHPGGHVIPGDSAVTAPIADFLARRTPSDRSRQLKCVAGRSCSAPSRKRSTFSL
jgi:hypothetical protein